MCKQKEQGFTLIELMIVIAIIGILAAVAVPQYGIYVQKSKFSDVISSTFSAKTAVSICAQERNGLATCTPGSLVTNHPGIPADIATPQGFIQSLTTASGVITATGTSDVGDHTYILTPTWNANSTINWTVGGTCIGAGFCR